MATSSLTVQNKFTTTLSTAVSSTDTVFYLASLPTGSEGYLTLDEGLSTEEVIYYTSKGANFVTLPSVGAGRGLDGTSAVGHSVGAVVKMKVTSSYWKSLQDGTALASGAITPDKLGLNPQYAAVATSETTPSTSYTDLATTGPSVTVTVPASGKVKVEIASKIANTVAGSANSTYVAVAMTGANVETAGTNTRREIIHNPPNNGFSQGSLTYLATGLTAGSTTFTLKYKALAGTGTFADRQITATPTA